MNIRKKGISKIIIVISMVTVCCLLLVNCQKEKSNYDFVRDLYSNDPAVRKAAAEMLGETMSVTGLVALNEITEYEQDPEVKEAMYKALDKIEKNREKLASPESLKKLGREIKAYELEVSGEAFRDSEGK